MRNPDFQTGKKSGFFWDFLGIFVRFGTGLQPEIGLKMSGFCIWVKFSLIYTAKRTFLKKKIGHGTFLSGFGTGKNPILAVFVRFWHRQNSPKWPKFVRFGVWVPHLLAGVLKKWYTGILIENP